MQTTPIHGPALAKALENQNPGPASPTGPVVLPVWLVPWLAVLGAVATSWMGFELYDFTSHTWHPEKVPAFILSLLATLGVVSPGWRRSGPIVAVFLALCLGAPALASPRGVLFGGPDRPALAAAPEPAFPLAPGYAVGVTLQADGALVPQLLAVGSLGLLDLGGRPLSLLLGGGLGAPGLGTVTPTGNLGLAWALPVRGDSEVALGVLATYGAGGTWSGGLTLVVSQLVHRE